MKNWASKFVEDHLPEHLFSYSAELIQNVRNSVNMTIALSGSPHEVVEELTELGFDKVYGSVFETKKGVYTGKVSVNFILGEEKAKFARKVSKELNIDLSRSMAFGDTDQDEPLLNIVGLPICVNPNKALREICESRGWKWLDRSELEKNPNITK